MIYDACMYVCNVCMYVCMTLQDDGVVAKVLVKEGTSDIAVGSPIFVLVESKDDVAAFAGFEAHAAPSAAAPKEAEPAAPPGKI